MAKVRKKSQYVVLDVETNGLSAYRDDLLSISLYKPDDKKTYERFLPLEKQSTVLTSDINGITKRQLKNKKPLSQKELDQLIDEFELHSRTILTYGNLDEKFIKHYLQSHHLKGYAQMKFYNFKHDVISSAFSHGNVTKDNLCKLYRIRGVRGIHSGLNDCILEWKLFEKMNGHQLLITNDDVFELNEEYIVSVSYLTYHTNFKYHLPNVPKLSYERNVIFTHSIVDKDIIRLDANGNGILIEMLMNQVGNVTEIDSRKFLLENKRKLKYIGTLPSMREIIYIHQKNDGSIELIGDVDKEYEKRTNKSFNIIKNNIGPLIAFLKEKIFTDGQILSQELMVDKEANVLANCDWSNKDCVLEIKSFSQKIEKYIYQLYYEAAGRRCFLMQTEWGYNPTSITFTISEITFKIKSEEAERKFEKGKTKHKEPGRKGMTIREYFKMMETQLDEKIVDAENEE